MSTEKPLPCHDCGYQPKTWKSTSIGLTNCPHCGKLYRQSPIHPNRVAAEGLTRPAPKETT